MTVELGTADEIRAVVQQAIATLVLAEFILAPIDNFTVDEPQSWENFEIFLEAWKSHWK